MAISRSKGTPDQLLNAVKNRIAELDGGAIEESTSIKSATGMSEEQMAHYEAVSEIVNPAVEAEGAHIDWSADDGGFNLYISYMDEEFEYYIDYSELGMTPDSVESDASYIINSVFGALDQVEGCTDTNSAADFDEMTHETVTAAEDDVDRDRYLHTLIGDCDAKLETEVDSTVWDNDKENIFLTVTYMDNVIELEIPFADLDMNWDTIDSDVAYIVNSVLQDLDNLA